MKNISRVFILIFVVIFFAQMSINSESYIAYETFYHDVRVARLEENTDAVYYNNGYDDGQEMARLMTVNSESYAFNNVGAGLYGAMNYTKEELDFLAGAAGRSLQMIRAGENYLTFSINQASPYELWMKNTLQLRDKEFNLIKEEEFEGDIDVERIAYFNGIYYCGYREMFVDRYSSWSNEGGKVTDNRFTKNAKGIKFIYHVAMSKNFENWIEVYIGEEEKYDIFIPITNKYSAVTDKKVCIIGDDEYSSVIYENAGQLNSAYKTVGEWFTYVEYNDNLESDAVIDDEFPYYKYRVCFTNDNIYFTRLKCESIPGERNKLSKEENINCILYPSYAYETESELVVISGYSGMHIPKAELYASLEEMKAAPYVRVNGTFLGFEKPPVIKGGRTLVPMRFLFEQMGAQVSWDEATQTATAAFEDKTVKIRVNSTTATVNGEPKTMDVAAEIMEDKTMIPLRFISENLGFNVSWNDTSRIADITN